jgi:lysophospholipase L1-like esterase
MTIPIDLYIIHFVALEPDVVSPTDIRIAAYDPGNGKVGLSIGYPLNILTGAPRIIGLGSSTMNAAGASSYANGLPGLLTTWVNTNSTGGLFIEMAENGKWSGSFVPDGENAASDWNLNIEAALALRPVIIILSLPSNDPSFNTNAQFLSNLQRVSDACRERNIYCFVTTTQPRTEYGVALQQMLYDAAQLIRDRFQNFAVDVFAPLAQPYTAQSPAAIQQQYRPAGDMIHVNNAGHTLIRNAVVTTMQAYFVDKNYVKYQVERSTSPTTDFSLYLDTITSNDIQFNRQDGQRYYYRVRAQRSDLSYTPYSNVASLQQVIYPGEVIQTMRLNFANTDRPGPVAGWNTLLPVGNVPTAGQEFTNMLDTTGTNSGISVKITGAFAGVRSNGGSGGPVFPLDVIRTGWLADATSRAELRFAGLDPAFLYTFKFLPSYSTAADAAPWYSGYVVGERSAFVAANNPVTYANNGTTADLLGLQPTPAGTVTVKIKALPAVTFAFVNALILQKLNQTNAIPLDLYTIDFTKLEPIVCLGGITEGVVNINLTGPLDADVPTWNKVNATTSDTVNDLTRIDGVNTSMGMRFTNIQQPRTDNGQGYPGSVAYPAPVMRYNIYRAGNPPMVVYLTNINPVFRVDLEIMCSANDVNNVQSLTVGSETKQVNVNDNLDRLVTFTHVQPNTTGDIAITVSWISGPITGFSYVTAMKATLHNTSLPVLLDLYTLDFVLDINQQNIPLPLYTTVGNQIPSF